MNPMRIIMVAALAALAGLSYGPVFGGFGAMLLLATLIPPGAVVIWALFARSRRISPAIAGLGVLTVTVVVAVTTRPGSAVTSGPYRLLTEALPADPGGPELATASALTGYAALAGCYLVLTRPAARLAPVLPPLICLLTGLGLGAATGELPVWYPPAFVALAGIQSAAAGQFGGGPDAAPRTAPRSLAVTAVLVLLGVVASISLTGPIAGSAAEHPADPRALIAGPVAPKASTNPFAQFLAMRTGQLSVRITGSASRPTERLRMITLTEFDGQTWLATADYRRAAHRLPPAPAGTNTRDITIDVTVSDPDALGWLPTAGRATEISIAGLGVDTSTGDVVVPAGTSTPASYRVTGLETAIDGETLLADEPAPATTALDASLAPNVLEFITTTASAHTGSTQLLTLYRALTSTPFGFDGSATEAASGHGLFQISALLRDRRGTSEQYASAFAVMGRYLGWDTRVVLGFRPHWNGNDLTVTGEDVHAWTEVRFARLGWVPVDPTPRKAAPGREPGTANAPPRSNDNPLDSLPDPGQATPPGPTNPTAEPSHTTGPVPPSSGPPVWALAAITISGTVALLLLGTPLAKSVRRARRRRTGTTRTRTVAAWQEALDTLRGAGLRPPHSATTGEIVRASGTTCPPELHTLAQQTDLAAFAPEEPDEADAHNAWTNSDNLRQTIRRRMPIHTRILTAIDPRPLRPSKDTPLTSVAK